jgi:hypothetical protein
MKSIFVIAAAAVAISPAYASFPIGTGSEGFITGDVGIKYDDNIYLTGTAAKSSAVYNVTPGVSLEFGTDALAKNILTLSEEIVRYSSASSQDNELAHVNYTGQYSDEKLKIDFKAGFNEIAQNTRDAKLVGAIAEHSETSAVPTFEWVVSPKTAFSLGGNWMEKQYDNSPGFVDSTTWELPANFYYEIAPKLQASVGYRYRSTDQDAAVDSTDNFFNLGARGTFTPKLTGTLQIGYTDRDIKRFGTVAPRSESTVGIESKFDYDYSAKTKLRASIKNDFASSAAGSTQEVLTLTGGINSALTTEFSVDANLNYNNYQYTGTTREEDFWSLDLAGTYKYNKYVSFKGGYKYQNNSSNAAGSDFTNNQFSVAAVIRY